MCPPAPMSTESCPTPHARGVVPTPKLLPTTNWLSDLLKVRPAVPPNTPPSLNWTCVLAPPGVLFAPTAPCGPCVPGAPCGPCVPTPAGPCGPCAPAPPALPCAPAAPCGPAAPCAPAAPCGPSAPCGPIRLTEIGHGSASARNTTSTKWKVLPASNDGEPGPRREPVRVTLPPLL